MDNGQLKTKTTLDFRILLFLTVLLFSNIGLAWNAAGHHLMAAITWDLLTTQQRDYWVDILEHHPRFTKDFKDHLPKYVKRNPQTYKEWIFRRASTWPDIARGIPAKQRDKYHHAKWHYINYPLFLDKKVNTRFLNRSAKWKGKFHNNLNLIQAIKGNLAVLSSKVRAKKKKPLLFLGCCIWWEMRINPYTVLLFSQRNILKKVTVVETP